ncbi:L-selectin-like [Xiphophorus couchianus]|uniref:L-selectin-like n=1 Tax=Xiphophorus couchianus TaxID=32473 RepID=UPI0010161E42|nr:L-selectin-like [Xiphophorus couchianus]
MRQMLSGLGVEPVTAASRTQGLQIRVALTTTQPQHAPEIHCLTDCYSFAVTDVKQFFYISTQKNWSSAQTYCRKNYVDLVVIENQEENNKAQRMIPNKDVSWIGLYRMPWTWSDGNHGLFRRWTSSSPSNTGGSRHCVTENNLHNWNDENCNTPHVFICYQVVKKAALVKVTTVTDADLTDPDISAQLLQQLGAVLTSQGWTDFKVRWKNIAKKKDNNENTV